MTFCFHLLPATDAGSLLFVGHHGNGTSWHKVKGSTVIRRAWLVEQAAKIRFPAGSCISTLAVPEYSLAALIKIFCRTMKTPMKLPAGSNRSCKAVVANSFPPL